MILSGFTFAHNCFTGGYPIREAVKSIQPHVQEIVAIDCKSTDKTAEVLRQLNCKVHETEWGTEAEVTLGKAHAFNKLCRGDAVLHFEADEVWDQSLIQEVVRRLTNGERNIIVHRIQVEQNFQRIRWYPHQVHRVFPPGGATKHPVSGHTTVEHKDVRCIIPPEFGMIWDCTYCFRDQWKSRAEQNAKLWGEAVNYSRAVPEHFLSKPEEKDMVKFLGKDMWTYKTTPLQIPEILKPLVGKTFYE